ncbi:hypothetical protein E1193_11915 [Micromonospora sp. KC606]|uniref:hypothetical protein n=1 Tax=Micromonospora sp. KC606 TaxID=2530379 RepID=UPI0010491B3B|nr:hypothetical protein [Micromonospora sp. KC606]TDC82441.1 hypothetical protein E1193_11915 [Micromonospora sp. KC606]
MELHRRPGRFLLPVICVLAGALLLAIGDGHGLLRTLVAVGGIALGVVVLAGTLRPFRFAADTGGLTVRRPGLRRRFTWAELDALVLEQPAPRSGGPVAPRLLAVPAAGAEVGPAGARHPVDDRPAVELLDLGEVRESPDEVSAALARCAGDRFLDARPSRRVAFPDPDFTVTLRGYRVGPVDALIRQGQEALTFGGPERRRAARAALDQARVTGLARDVRGYSVPQVDEALDALAAALTEET